MRMVLFALILSIGAARVWAQEILDPGFVPALQLTQQSFAVQSDGKILVGSGHISRLNPDGSLDTSFSAATVDSAGIKAIFLQPDGKILIAGDFAAVNDVPVAGFARLNADGSLDDGFIPNTMGGTSGGSVNSFAVQPDGKLLIAGAEISVEGQAPTCLTRLNSDGSLDPTFADLAASADFLSSINTIALRADGKILAAGVFDLPNASGGDNPSTLARFNADGSIDADLTGASSLNIGRTVVAQPDGRILVGGRTLDNNVAFIRLGANDVRDTSFNPQLDQYANSVYVQPNGKIVIAGYFTAINGEAHGHIARLNADGSVDESFDMLGTGGPNGGVVGLAAQSDGKILVSGPFTTVGLQQVARPGLARLLVPEPAVQQLRFGVDHNSVQWLRSGSGVEFACAAFDISVDDSTWSTLGAGVWQDGNWSLDGLQLPPGNIWLRARGSAATGSGDFQGISGSVIESLQQLVATVTPSAGPGGTIAPTTPQFVDVGSIVSFTITPDDGQRILSVGGTCGGALSGSTYTTSVVTADCSVQAAFAPSDTLTVTPSATAGGSIAPSTPQSAVAGDVISFTLSANAGYSIGPVGGTCGGTLAGNLYTTAAIVADCSVEANFTLTAFTVTASVVGANGSIAPASQTVNSGNTATLLVTRDIGYNANVSGCGGVLVNDTYTTAPITADCEVTAQFTPISAAGISMMESVSTDGSCGSSTSVMINQGDLVTICTSFLNASSMTLAWIYTDDSLGYSPGGGFPLPCGATGCMPGAPVALSQRSLYFFSPATITSTVVGLDNAPPHYSFDDSTTFTWVELATSPTATQLPIDTSRPFDDAHVQMPFSFGFYGYPTDGNLCVSKNGDMRFSSGASCADESAVDFTESNLVIAPAQGSFLGSAIPYFGGNVYSEIQGDAPSRRTIIEWSQMSVDPTFGGSGSLVTFEAILEETTGAITFQYLAMDTGNPATSNGVAAIAQLMREKPSLAVASNPLLVYSNDQPLLTSGKAVRFMPTANPSITATTAVAEVQIATPVATAAPGSLNATVAVNGSTSATLTIGNSGNAPLTWNIGEQAGTTGFRIDSPYSQDAQTSAARLASAQWNEVNAASAHNRLMANSMIGTVSAPPKVVSQGAAAVPAYAETFGQTGIASWLFASFDAAAPSALSPIAGLNYPVEVGAFINNDFSKEFMIANAFAGDAGQEEASVSYLSITDGNRRYVGGGVQFEPYAPGTNAYEFYTGMKWDATTHILYGVASNAGPGSNPAPSCGSPPTLCRSDLFAIDPNSGLSTWIAQIDAIDPNVGTIIADIAIAPNGDMYGLDMIDDTFYVIDKATGHVRPIGASGLAVGYWPQESMDFDQSTGILYYATWPVDGTPSGMYSVDLSTGAAQYVDRFGSGGIGARALAIAKPGGPCANPADVPWLSFDTSSGDIDPKGSANVTVTFNGSGLGEGVYNAKICVNSNTHLDSSISVPVAFTVGNGDHIFLNGFEAG